MKKSRVIKNEIREKITEAELKHNVKLSTIQKILLSINGPVTAVLDVLYGEVGLFMLDQHLENADKETADLLGINENDEIIYRNSLVIKDNHPILYVVSYIPTARCSRDTIDDLFNCGMTTAKIMDAHNIETIRKITKIDVEEATPFLTEVFKTTEDMLTREYTMTHKKKVVIWTKELCPLSYFAI